MTADHGQVNLGQESWIGLGALDGMVDAYAGDARFRYLHAREGAARGALVAAEEAVGDHAWVFSRDQLLDEGWLGPDPAGPARRRVGDVVLAARDAVGFVDPTFPRETGLRSAHGSITAGRGRGPAPGRPGPGLTSIRRVTRPRTLRAGRACAKVAELHRCDLSTGISTTPCGDTGLRGWRWHDEGTMRTMGREDVAR